MSYKKLVLAAALPVLLCCFGADSVGPPSLPIDSQELGTKYTVTGQLAKTLGTYVTVEGEYWGPRAMVKCGLYVDHVDGQVLAKPVRLFLAERLGVPRLERARRYKLRGFETGAFEGVPDDPANPPPAGLVRQQVNPPTLEFVTEFYVETADTIGRRLRETK